MNWDASLKLSHAGLGPPDRSQADAWFNKGLTLKEMGQKQEAAQVHRKFIVLAPTGYQPMIEHARQFIPKMKTLWAKALGQTVNMLPTASRHNVLLAVGFNAPREEA